MRLRIHLPEGTSDWESNVAVFRVGRADSCALRFDGEAAKYSGWEHAEFNTDARGAVYLIDLQSKNGTYLDGVRVAVPTPLRIGAVVQIGTKGPKLEVLELAPPVSRQAAPAPVGVQNQSVANQVAPVASSGIQKQSLAIGAAAALLIVVVLLLMRGAGTTTTNPGPIVNAPNEHGEKDPPEDKDPPEEEVKNDIVRETPETVPPPQTVDPPDEDGKKPPPNLQPAIAAYWLIVAEEPESGITYPLSGAIAVADHALLTTAAPTMELAQFKEKNWPLKAINPSDGQVVTIGELRVHPIFQRSAPEDQLFFDAALVYTVEPLPAVVTLASEDELDRLDVGLPLTCIAAHHERVPFKGAWRLPPTLRKGVILEPRYPRQQPRSGAAPAALVLLGSFQDWYFGDPIINGRGHLVALYCGPTVDEGPGKHFAKVIEPGLIEGANDRESSIWVPISAASNAKDPAQ